MNQLGNVGNVGPRAVATGAPAPQTDAVKASVSPAVPELPPVAWAATKLDVRAALARLQQTPAVRGFVARVREAPDLARELAMIVRHGPGVAPAPDDPMRIEATRADKAMVATSLGLIALLEGQALLHVAGPADAAWAGAGALGALVAADGISHLFHYLLDNYDLGELAVHFKAHHRHPRAQTHEDFAVSVKDTGKAAAVIASALILTDPGVVIGTAAAITLLGAFYAQEAHKNAHRTPHEVPRLFRLLQKTGLSLTREEHNGHHRSPHDGQYGIITGGSNAFFAEHRITEKLSALIYRLTGVEAESWKLDPRVKVRALGVAGLDQRALDALHEQGRPTEARIDASRRAPYDYEGAVSLLDLRAALSRRRNP